MVSYETLREKAKEYKLGKGEQLTRYGSLKMNLAKQVYIDLINEYNNLHNLPKLFTTTNIREEKMSKQELYRRAKDKGIHIPWVGSSAESIKKILEEEEHKVSSFQEIDNFFAYKEPNHEITIRPLILTKYLNKITFTKDLLLQLGIEINGTMTYRFLKQQDKLKEILNRIQNGFYWEDKDSPGSDMDLIQEAAIYGHTITLQWIRKDATFRRNKGAYLSYYHTTKLDLSRYQCYREEQKDIINKEACFLYALRQSGISSEELDKIKLMLIQENLNTNDIKLISGLLNIKLHLTYYSETEKRTRNVIYNKKGLIEVHIGLAFNHYFINEKTNITLHALQHYAKCKDHKYFPNCQVKKDNIYPPYDINNLTSYEVILGLFTYQHVIPITLSNGYDLTERLVEYDKLVLPNEKEYKHYGDSKIRNAFGHKKVDSYDIICCDYETFIDSSLGYHIPYCLSYTYIEQTSNLSSITELSHKDPIYSIYGLDCAQKFLSRIRNHSIIITHNLSFDFKMMQDYLTDIRACIQTGTQIKTITASYNGYTLVFKDNCAFLSYKLSDLPSLFKLDSGDKESYPYSLIKKDNYQNKIHLEDCLRHVADKETFISNSLKFRDDYDLVDIPAYTIHYCEQDVRILVQAFCCFANQILSISSGKINILHSISLSQVADDYFRWKGCYDDCYSFNGVVHDFIRRCVIGGRVMCAYNKKKHIKEYLNDFDAVSLYPSSMYRIPGYLKGLPKIIDVFTPSLYTHYFIEIVVTRVGKARAFPLTSIKVDGIHNFTNDLVGKHIYVDKTTLEDLLQWQDISYEFVRGYYFDEGYNDRIKTVIQDVFEKRKQYKKEKNSLEQTYKLIMNSSYGKLCQKPITRKIIFKDPTLVSTKNFLINNYENIVEYTMINDHLYKIVMEKSIINHFAPVHLACQILSMSKRIMNEVMCLAEDYNIPIYYQDTDSMHIPDASIPRLEELFSQVYQRNLIGSEMGQFHSDFSIFDALGKKVSQAYDIKSCESIFLGKKCYIDKLEYKLPNSSDLHYSHHIRMKGVCSAAIVDQGDPMKTYFNLYRGKSKTFDLTPYCVMQASKNLRMIARESFVRKVRF